MLPRAVVVTRPTDYEELLARHSTRAQARFHLSMRGQSIDDIEERHHRFEGAARRVSQAIPVKWRRTRVGRADLSRFVWEPGDLVLPVGQDGLVANVAKYLSGQLVIGVNPDPGRNDGILVPHPPEAVADLLGAALSGRISLEERAMVEARLDDGQRLRALNEVFLGHRSHQSARYRLEWNGFSERQSSSGLIVATGTGSSGWARSIRLQRTSGVTLPAALDRDLVFLVREAFPSVSSGASLTEGRLDGNRALEVISEMNDGGVLFGDGIENDRLDFGWGLRARISVAELPARLVRGFSS
jgi:NAD kinase